METHLGPLYAAQLYPFWDPCGHAGWVLTDLKCQNDLLMHKIMHENI